MRRDIAILLMLTITGAGCRKQVKAPLTAAPPAAVTTTTTVDLTKTEPAPLATPIPTAEDAEKNEEVVKVAPAVESTMLIARPVRLSYPADAKARHLTGKVRFRAIVGSDGTVKGLTMIETADPIFVDSATASVQSWLYKPYLLNGKPVAVDTIVTVIFTLAE